MIEPRSGVYLSVTWSQLPSQLAALGREVNAHSHSSLHLAVSIYGFGSRAEIINVSYRMDPTIAPDRHSASAERVDLSSVLVAKVRFREL